MISYVGLDWAGNGWIAVTATGDGAERRRRCDEEAKSVLGESRSSVFYTPVRAAVYEGDYAAAGDANEDATGDRISTQACHICPPIRRPTTGSCRWRSSRRCPSLPSGNRRAA